MQQRTTKILYDTHSWTGVLCAILLFIVCFSGTVALFIDELTQWERPTHRISYDPDHEIDVDALVNLVLQNAEVNPEEIVFLHLPSSFEPTLSVSWADKITDQRTERHINPNTGEVLPPQGKGFSELLRRMHTDLLLPRPWGRYFIGVLGLVLLLSIVTGVLIHRKIFKDIFKFRFDRSLRLLWTDLHKIFGVWVLPFHLMIALTGAWLGLLGFVVMIAAFSAFDGDLEKAAAAVLGERATVSGEPGVPLNINAALNQYKTDRPDNKPHFIIIEAFGDKNEVINVQGTVDDALVGAISIKYESATGRQVHVTDPVNESKGPFMRTFFAVTPLHYALYGGTIVKLVYFVLGLSLCLMMVTGTWIWLERREKRYQLLAHLTIGICGGMLVATAATFWANKLLPQTGLLEQRYYAIGLVYFSVWVLCLIWTFIRRREYQAVKDLLLLTGLLLLGAPVLNHVFSDVSIFQVLPPWPVIGVDIMNSLLGIILIFVARRLPDERPRAVRPKRTPENVFVEDELRDIAA